MVKGDEYMSFRYDMQNKTPQQQEIVRRRDAEDKKRTEEYERKQKELAGNSITWLPVKDVGGDYKAVWFTKGNRDLLELRISRTAIVVDQSGLRDRDIYEWLGEVGKGYAESLTNFEVIIITSNDVRDQKLITDWKNLKRDIEASE